MLFMQGFINQEIACRGISTLTAENILNNYFSMIIHTHTLAHTHIHVRTHIHDFKPRKYVYLLLVS